MENGTDQKWLIPIMPLCINGKPGFMLSTPCNPDTSGHGVKKKEREHLKMFTPLDVYYANSTHEITLYLQHGKHLMGLMSKIGVRPLWFVGHKKLMSLIGIRWVDTGLSCIYPNGNYDNKK